MLALALNAGVGWARSEVAVCCAPEGSEYADLTIREFVVWYDVAFGVVSDDVAGAVCGFGMMSFSPGCRTAPCDRSFVASRLVTGMPNDCAMLLSVSPTCTV